MVVAGDGLHENANQHSDGEQDQFDDHNGGEAAEPVGGLVHGQSVMDAIKVDVALAPEEFCGIEGGHDVKKQDRAALDGLQHEISDWPNVLFGEVAGKVAVVDAEGDEERHNAPERYVAKNIAPAPAGEGRG